MIGGLRIAQILASMRRPLPRLVNRDGDPFEFIEARYGLTSTRRNAIEARLDAESAIETKSVAEAMAEKPAAPRSTRRTVPKRVEREITGRFLEDHYRKWLDDKLPILGGKTPREAARDFDGREQLVALLKDLENHEARRARDRETGYDVRWLWRELGIEHLRR